MIDLASLAGRTPRLEDFVLRAGSGAEGASWRPLELALTHGSTTPPEVQFVLRRGAGANSSDRVTLGLPNDVAKNQWLRVTVLPTERTGLATPDVFYFGSLVGESGDAASPLGVGALDLSTVRRSLNRQSTVTSAADVDKDGRVTALDLSAVRAAMSRTLAALAAPPLPPPRRRRRCRQASSHRPSSPPPPAAGRSRCGADALLVVQASPPAVVPAAGTAAPQTLTPARPLL